jgi:hypothetical protein
MNARTDPYEREYRRAGQLLTSLFVFYLPLLGLLGFVLGRLLDELWPVFLCLGLWMVALAMGWAVWLVAGVRLRKHQQSGGHGATRGTR